MKFNKKVFAIIFVALMLVISVMLLTCRHETTYSNVVLSATCCEEGQEEIVCAGCEKVLEVHALKPHGHSFGSFELVSAPHSNGNGEEVRTCSDCDYKESREVVCEHGDVSAFTVKEPTCSEEGQEVVICNICEAVAENNILEKLPHEKTNAVVVKEPSCCETGVEAAICEVCGETAGETVIEMLECTFGDWVYTTYATPFEEGERYHDCTFCGKRETESYTVELAPNSIYIPSAGINATFAITSFTQGAMDSNDVIYTENAYAVEDANNPFVSGHWYGSMHDLHKTKIGSKIYVNVNGRIDTYEVVVSEYALEVNRLDWIGQETGVNCWDTYASKIPSQNLRLSRRQHAGVDRWEDINDGKTLHAYTCYYDRGEPWKPEHGRLGRWIVVATTVDGASSVG